MAKVQLAKELEEIVELAHGDLLGKGSTGIVCRGDMRGGGPVAVKLLDRAKLKRMGFAEEAVRREAEIMRACLRRPHLVQLWVFAETAAHFFFVMELCLGGDLFAAMRGGDAPLREMLARQLLRQMFAAVAYLHSLGICHRDIKPHNFLLDRPLTAPNVQVKLGDFGVAVWLPLGQHVQELKGPAGTPAFMAPEQQRRSGQTVSYDHAVDVWALGVILLFLLTGRHPFVDQRGKLLNDRLARGEPLSWRTPFGAISDDACDLTKRLLAPVRTARPRASDAVRHEWLTGHADGESNDSDEEDQDLTFFQWMASGFKEQFNGMTRSLSVSDFADSLGADLNGRCAEPCVAPCTAKIVAGTLTKQCVVCKAALTSCGHHCNMCQNSICTLCLRRFRIVSCPQCKSRIMGELPWNSEYAF